jgi:hypothetical protein
MKRIAVQGIFLGFFLSWCLVYTVCAQDYTKVTFIRHTESKVHGQLFTHRVDVVDGQIKDRWTVDGKPVIAKVYDEQLESATLSQMRELRAAEQKQLREQEFEIAKQQEFNQQVALDLHRKCLKKSIEGVEHELVRIKDSRLAPYYVFEKNSYTAPEQFDRLIMELMPEAKRVVADQAASLDTLQRLSKELESHPQRLREFFRITVKHAVSTCDDTRMLRDFLELVAE